MPRVPTEDHRLEVDEGRTVGYAIWGEPAGTNVFIVHGMPGSRLDRYPSLDDPKWLSQRHLRFVGIDRPGYGRSDPWPEATLLDCAGDFVRVADDLGMERFSALGISGGALYVLALAALVPERVGRVAIVSGLFEVDAEAPDELAAELDEEARAIREDPEGSLAEFFAGLAEVDRRMVERPEVRDLFIETIFREGLRQGATGWVDDNLRLARPRPFRLDEIGAEVQLHHGEADVLEPPHQIVEEIPGSSLRLYLGEGHLSIDRHVKEIVDILVIP